MFKYLCPRKGCPVVKALRTLVWREGPLYGVKGPYMASRALNVLDGRVNGTLLGGITHAAAVEVHRFVLETTQMIEP